MDVWIQNNQGKKKKLPYHAFPIYQLFYEQIGLKTKWDQTNHTLHLSSYLQGKKIFLVARKQDDILRSILESVKLFLNQMGVEFIELPKNSTFPEDGEIILDLKWSFTNSTSRPRFNIRLSQESRAIWWAKAFQQECTRNEYSFHIKEAKKQFALPILKLHCHIPESMETDKQMQENISFLFVLAILRGLTKDNPFMLLPFISLETVHFFLPMEQTKTSDSKSSEKSAETSTLPIKNNSMFHLEVYFDHQVIVPSSEDDTFLVIGNLHLKNTGIGALLNPIICFQITPFDKVTLKGQIIPPKMVDTVGVQSFNGETAVGWRYLEDDWFQQAKEKGEYSICPIQPMTIPPGETITFSNFQFSIPKSDMDETITIKGIVHFKEQNLQFPANNRIVLSCS